MNRIHNQKECDFITANGHELFYWHTNKEWYQIHIEEGYCELTEKAPPEAVESFKKWCAKTGLGKGKQEMAMRLKLKKEES